LLPITPRQLHRVVCETANAVGIEKRVSPHTLRHNAESRIMPSDFAMPLRSAQTKASVRSTGA
jgi:site-specific recombinase XerD